jgi:hypothetical protein
MMKKTILLLFAGVFFLLSGFSVYSYFHKKDLYHGQTVVPERRDDLPLYKGLTFIEHSYEMKGNHWYAIYEFYKNELPQNGWKLVNKNVSLENNGGFTMDWEKNDKNLSVYGSWNSFENQTEIMFDLNPVLHNTVWIQSIPDEVCVYADSRTNTCSKISDRSKIEQLTEWVNDAAYDKEDAPLQQEFGIIDTGDLRIEVHYDPKFPSFTLKSNLGKKQMKPEKLLELTGLTHLKNK